MHKKILYWLPVGLVLALCALGDDGAGAPARAERPARERPDLEERRLLGSLHRQRREDFETLAAEVQLELLRSRKERRRSGHSPREIARRYFELGRAERIEIIREEKEKWSRLLAATDAEKIRLIREETASEPRLPPPPRRMLGCEGGDDGDYTAARRRPEFRKEHEALP
jgi:hypothetical protein